MNHRVVLSCGAALSLALLCGCPDQGVVCGAGTNRCGLGCADFSSDSRNCGACGQACQLGQVCHTGDCVCQEGTSACDGACVVTQSASHCGSCGAACAVGEVCEQGACRSACVGAGLSQCAGACVDLNSTSAHCGACDSVCPNAQSCRRGVCGYDVIAACFSSGQLAGIQASTGFRGPLTSLGSGPAALAAFGNILLSADGLDNRLYQARLDSLEAIAGSTPTSSAPNHVVVDGPYVYVANAGGGTVQVLASADGGAALSTIAELPFGANTYPEAIAQLGTKLYVPLYGGYGAGASAGQKLAEVDVSNRATPTLSDSFDLAGLDLHAFDGGHPVPRPYAIAAQGGKLYVALNNLNPDTYAVEGPGMLAKLDPQSRTLTGIDLGAERCLNPVWVASADSTDAGAALYVSCAGRIVYGGPPAFAAVAVERSAVVLVQDDQVRSSWEPSCPATALDAGTGCLPVVPGRLAVHGGRVFVGDQNGGRLFVLAASNLSELRGYADGGTPIQACPIDSVAGLANVSDLLAVP